MNASKTNIKFNYLYRDAANYKNFGSIVLSNPNDIPIDKLRTLITNNLIDNEFFDPIRIKVPQLFFYPYNSDDHTWHEFENIEETNEIISDSRTIEDLLSYLREDLEKWR